MKPNIEKIIKDVDIDTNAKMDKAVLNDVLEAFENSTKKKPAVSQPNIWRTIIKSRITKLATVAAIMIVVALSITFLDKSVAPAYAIEQTIEANRGMRYLHTKYFDSSHDDVAKECWLEFDKAGQPKIVRISWSKWMGGGKIMIWNQNETKLWSKTLNQLLIFNDKIYSSRVHSMMESEDPKLMAKHIYEREAKGEVKIEIDEPTDKTEPIVVTATYLPGSPSYGDRKLLFIDRSTKLVTRLELYVLKEGEYKYYGVIEYYDYNVPISAKMYNLDDEVSADATRINTKNQDVGLAQGELSDQEIAVKMVREFFGALIAEDYATAGQLWGGLAAVEVRKRWGKLKVIRLVSIGEPVSPSKASKIFPKMQCVPYTIEVERDGKKTTLQKQQNIRRVLGRRKRWVIH